MAIRHVLKPFRFSRPAEGGSRLPTEIRFEKGTQDIPEDILSHQWVAEGADGSIEHPSVTVERLNVEKKKREAEDTLAAKSLRDAQAAFDRLVASQPARDAANAQVAADIDKPIGQLKSDYGDDINKPVNQLNDVKPIADVEPVEDVRPLEDVKPVEVAETNGKQKGKK